MERIAYRIENLRLNFRNEKSESNFELNIPELIIPGGSIVGIVGESGCGKTTLGKLLIGLITFHSYRKYGISSLEGNIINDNQDVMGLRSAGLKEFRNNVQMIFQNPRSALNLNMPLRQIFLEVFDKDNDCSRNEKLQIIAQFLKEVSLISEEDNLNQYLKQRPRELSGGQRRRVGIVKVLIKNPNILIADEPVASLDVSIQGQILALLKDWFNEDSNRTLIIITHNMRIIEELADSIIVMYNGNVVEYATKDEWYSSHTHHPYTEHLRMAADYLYYGKEEYASDSVTALEEYVIREKQEKESECKFYSQCPIKDEACKDFNIRNYDFTSGSHRVACVKVK